MQKDYLFNNQSAIWFKSGTFKVSVLVLVILAIVSMVLFNKQISDLVKLFGLRAATQSKYILIDANNRLILNR